MDNISNPFVECTARDMTYSEVSNYWCSPFECFAIDEKMLHESTTPIVLAGARGSGKTMILKYISYFCQKECAKKLNIEILELLKRNKSIGFYFRYSDDFGELFKNLKCTLSDKHQLFKQYYELYICSEIVRVVSDMYDENIIEEEKILPICKGFSTLLKTECVSINEVYFALQNHIKLNDSWIKRSRFSDKSNEELEHILKYDNLVNGFVSVLRNNIEDFKNINFTIIIDEFENAAEYQVIFNTLIKQVNSENKITYRIGTRPAGMNMNKTNVGNEVLQPDRDFILHVLRYKNINEYKKFIANIANLRLKTNTFFNERGLTNIRKMLGERENMVWEAKTIVGENNTKHFELLKKYPSIVNESVSFDEIVDMLRNKENPLAEMLNVIWVIRGITPKSTSLAMQDYFSVNYNAEERNSDTRCKLAYKYKLDYVDKYKYPLLFVLLSIYKKKKKYYSFNTFSYLSSGAVNDFISLCRNTFYSLPSKFYDFAQSETFVIPADIQTRAAEITAVEQIDKVKLINQNGTKMYNFLMSVGEYFRYMHKDMSAKYPETNQFAFEDISAISLDDTYESLISWGVIVRKERLQSISIGAKRGFLFYLNRIYTPAFNISYRTRGGYNLVISNDLYKTMLSKSCESKEILSYIVSSKKKRIVEDKKNDSENDRLQIKLFD